MLTDLAFDHCLPQPCPAPSTSGQSRPDSTQHRLWPLSSQVSLPAAHLDCSDRLTSGTSRVRSGEPGHEGKAKNNSHHRPSDVKFKHPTYTRTHLHSWISFLSWGKQIWTSNGAKWGEGGIVYQSIKFVFGFTWPKMWVTIVLIWGWMMYWAGLFYFHSTPAYCFRDGLLLFRYNHVLSNKAHPEFHFRSSYYCEKRSEKVTLGKAAAKL